MHLLEIAAVTLTMDDDGNLLIDQSYSFNVNPFEGANLEKSALEFTGKDPYNPLRGGQLTNWKLWRKIFKPIRKSVKAHNCKRAILVGHKRRTSINNFVTAAAEPLRYQTQPVSPVSTFDTATLAGLAFGHTVLAKACDIADIDFDGKEAHSALYDTMKTAELFCTIVNRWKDLGGWSMVQDHYE